MFQNLQKIIVNWTLIAVMTGDWSPKQRGPRCRLYGGQQQQAECERDWRSALVPLRMESDDAAFRSEQSDRFRAHHRRSGFSSWSTYTCLCFFCIYSAPPSLLTLWMQHKNMNQSIATGTFSNNWSIKKESNNIEHLRFLFYMNVRSCRSTVSTPNSTALTTRLWIVRMESSQSPSWSR